MIIASLMHHFNEDENRQLTARVARELRPGGVYERDRSERWMAHWWR